MAGAGAVPGTPAVEGASDLDLAGARICVLGPLTLMRDGELAFAPRRGRPHALLAALAAHYGQVVPADALVHTLWGDALPANPAGALQSQVFRLRRALGLDGDRIDTVGTGYRLTGPPGGLDAELFRTYLDRANTCPEAPESALAHVDAALALWGGAPFGESADLAVLRPFVERLLLARAEAEEFRIELLIRLGRTAEAARDALGPIAADPFAERPVVLAARALAAAGRHADALAQCRTFRRRLRDELGLEPSRAIRDVEEFVLRHLADAAPKQATLSLPGNSFVGRDAELAAVIERLDRARLVTVIGAGGVGKTRLALHAAAALAARYPDGVLVCELAGVSDNDGVPAAVATALRVDRSAGANPQQRVVEYLAGLRLLLVLDNCEHVATAVAQLVSVVLPAAPEVAVLATSRTALGAAGEQRLLLGPLATVHGDGATGPAAELFLDRLRALRHGSEPDTDTRAAIAELCDRAGGLPLAVELAAAQCLARSPVEVAAQWQSWGTVRDGRRAVGRHRSMEAVVGWSYELLAPEERSVFERLSVFRGGCDFAAAAFVAGPVDPGSASGVRVALTSLVAASLVTVTDRGGPVRYSMLEPIRQYAAARLVERGEQAQVRSAHADWAVQFAESADAGLRSAEEAVWHRDLHSELANLRAAHRWCLEQDPSAALRLAGLYWFTLWHSAAEVIDWTSATLDRHGCLVDPSLPTAYATAAVGAWWRGDFTGARAFGERAVAAAPSPDHPSTRFAWEALGDAAIWEHDHDRALACLDVAVATAHDAGDLHQATTAALTRALALAYAGEVDRAIADLAGLRTQIAAAANPTCTAFADYVEAAATMSTRPGYALRLLQRAAAIASAAHNEFLAHDCLQARITYQVGAGAAADAVPALAALVAYWHRVGNWNQQWTTIAAAADALALLDRAEEATVIRGALARSPHPKDAEPVGGGGDLLSHGAALGPEEVVRYTLDCLTAFLSSPADVS